MPHIRSRLLLLAVTSCAAIPPSPTVRPELARATYYNAETTAPRLGPFERDLLRRVGAHRRRRGRSPPRLDASLSAVAREYSREALRTGRRPPGAFLDFLLPYRGVTEPHPILFYASFPVEAAPAFPERFESQLDRLLADDVTDLGLVALKAGGRVGVSIVLLQRAARLGAIPQRVSPGAVVPVRGRLLPSYRSPTLMVTTPTGTFRQEALPLRDGTFEGLVRLDDGPGVYTVEVVASGPLGPTVVSLFPLYSGVAPPERFRPPPDKPATPESERAAERMLLDLINEERARRGLPPLQLNPRLADVARRHSLEMRERGFVGHRSPRTGTLADRLRRAGLAAAVSLENIARNDSLSGAHHGLMASPGHRRNILDPRVREVGVGVVYGGAGAARQLYVTQNFILPVAIVDPLTAEAELRSGAQRRRARLGLPALTRDDDLEAVARVAARRLLARGSVDAAEGQAIIRAEMQRRGLRYGALTAHLFIARDPSEPLRSGAWTRPGTWRAGVAVAQQPSSAFGDWALCVVLLLAPEAPR